jgi:hypothetical protein
MSNPLTSPSNLDKEIKKAELRKKANEARDEMIVPLEIRILAGLPYAILILYVTYLAVDAQKYRPSTSLLLWISLIFLTLLQTFIRYLFKGVGIIPYLLGMSYVDRESGYLVDRDQMWELIKREYYNRLTMTNFKHLFDLLDGPYYRTISMKEFDYVIGYRKQARILRYYIDTLKKESF